jgi:hypothetical protein
MILGILADMGLLLSLMLVLTGWGIAGLVVGVALGCASIGVLVGSLAATPSAQSNGHRL